MRHSSFLLALGASLLIGGCHKEAPPPPPLQHVNALEVQPHNVEYVFSYPGVVQGVIDYPVIPRVSGAIFKQLYKEGSLVKRINLSTRSTVVPTSLHFRMPKDSSRRIRQPTTTTASSMSAIRV